MALSVYHRVFGIITDGMVSLLMQQNTIEYLPYTVVCLYAIILKIIVISNVFSDNDTEYYSMKASYINILQRSIYGFIILWICSKIVTSMKCSQAYINNDGIKCVQNHIYQWKLEIKHTCKLWVEVKQLPN